MKGGLRWILAGAAVVAVFAVGSLAVVRWACSPEAAAPPEDEDSEAPSDVAGSTPPGIDAGSGTTRVSQTVDGQEGVTSTVDAGPIVAAPAGVGAVAGMVFDREDQAAAGVAVTVRRDEPDLPWSVRRPSFGPPEAGLGSARVDGDGFFRIEGLPAGPVAVEAGGAGYVRAVQRGVEVPPGDEAWVEFRLDSGLVIAGRVTDDRGAPIGGAAVTAHAHGQDGREWAATARDGSYELTGLRAGTYQVEADASGFVAHERDEVRAGTTGVDFQLGRAGAIAGRVVWRGAGSPIEGAEVRATSPGARRMRGPGRGAPSTRTGSDGRFVLDDLDPGSYVVWADAAARAPGTSPEVTLAPGQRVEGLVIELGEGARVTGLVLTDPDRRPVEGATVSISEAGTSPGQRRGRGAPFGPGRGGESPAPNPELSTTTDARGRFELSHVGAGPQLVTATLAGYPEARTAVQVPEAGDVTGVELRLPAGGSIAGTVYDSRGADRVASSIVFAGLESGAMGPSGTAEVDATGQYRIDGLLPGGYRVMVMRMQGGPGGGGPRGPDMSVPERTVVRAGETAVVDFHLGGGVAVHGLVLQGGQPVPGASVSFSSENDPFGGRTSAVSGEDGAYEVDGLEPGRYAVRVERTPLRAEIPDVDDFELDLELPTGALAGRVLDGGTGAPVADARVRVLRTGAADAGGTGSPMASSAFIGSTRTGTDGTFEVTGLAEGACEVQVSHPDYSPGKLAAEIPAGGRREGLELRLQPGARLAGKVVDAAGQPVAEAAVVLSDLQSGTTVRGDMRGRMTGLDGRFEVSGLSPGRYGVRAMAQGFAPSAVQTGDTSAGADALVLRLTGGGRLELTVTDSAGRPAAGVRVELLDPVTGRDALPPMPFGFAGQRPVSDDAGRLVYEHLAPGSYLLRAVSTAGPGPQTPAQVREGETTTAGVTTEP